MASEKLFIRETWHNTNENVSFHNIQGLSIMLQYIFWQLWFYKQPNSNVTMAKLLVKFI